MKQQKAFFFRKRETASFRGRAARGGEKRKTLPRRPALLRKGRCGACAFDPLMGPGAWAAQLFACGGAETEGPRGRGASPRFADGGALPGAAPEGRERGGRQAASASEDSLRNVHGGCVFGSPRRFSATGTGGRAASSRRRSGRGGFTEALKGRALPAGGKLLSAYGAGNASAALAWGGSGSRKRKRRRSGTGKTRAFSGRAVPAEERRTKEARERANAFLPPKSLLPEKIPAPESVPGGEKSVSHGRRTVGRMAAKLRGSGSQAVTDVSFCAKRRAGPFLRGIWPPCAARSSRRARR